MNRLVRNLSRQNLSESFLEGFCSAIWVRLNNLRNVPKFIVTLSVTPYNAETPKVVWEGSMVECHSSPSWVGSMVEYPPKPLLAKMYDFKTQVTLQVNSSALCVLVLSSRFVNFALFTSYG